MAATILLAAAVWGGQAQAQPRQVVTTCGTQTLVVGDGNNGYINSKGAECVTIAPSATTPAGGNQYALALVTAKALTIPVGALVAVITVEAQPIRCTTDGTTTPTASVGSLFQVAAQFSVWGTALADLQCIQTASAAAIDVEYFK